MLDSERLYARKMTRFIERIRSDLRCGNLECSSYGPEDLEELIGAKARTFLFAKAPGPGGSVEYTPQSLPPERAFLERIYELTLTEKSSFFLFAARGAGEEEPAADCYVSEKGRMIPVGGSLKGVPGVPEPLRLALDGLFFDLRDGSFRAARRHDLGRIADEYLERSSRHCFFRTRDEEELPFR